MPSDIIGMNIYNQKTGEFQLMPGPVMTQILLADEINRAVPRTQSALLEAMEERQVTIDGQTYPLSQPFVVMATQNPIETAGTFILPEAQMDRFLMKISVGYPSLEEERQMLANLGDEMPFSTVNTVLEPLTIRSLISACQHVHISEHVMAYIVTLVQATRNHPQIRFGASPRASRALYKAAKAWAAMHQRAYVTPDDVQQLAAPVLAHRIALKRETTLSGLNSEGVIRAIIASIPVPTHREATLHA
jgi:MoxR-like ATPase